MTSALQASPNTYDAGLAFNYAVWTPNTVLTLCNVKWNNDYRDIVRFATKDALNTYIDSIETATVTNATLAKFGQNVRVDIPINAAMRFNYLRASNPAMPVNGDVQRDYYYFVTGVNYLNPSTTELILQLDVWQTFGYDVTFGSCFVERGHIGIANTNAFNHYGRDYLTEPEGLDVGAEYRIVHVSSQNIMQPEDHTGYSILICSAVDLTVDPGTFGSDSASAMLKSASGGTFEQLTPGASFYVFPTAADFQNFLSSYADKPWVTQSILSVTLIPEIHRYHPGLTFTNVSPVSGVTFYYAPPDSPTPKTTPLASAWRDDSFLSNILGTRYAGLKKFLTYPYLVIELTTWTGAPLIIKPEMWQDPDATVRELATMVPPGQRIVVLPYKYNADAETGVTSGADPSMLALDDFGEFLDFGAVIDDFPQLAIVNNMAVAYLAANRHQIAWQNQSAEWTQQRALQTNQVGYDQANAAIALTGNLANTGIGAAQQQAALAADMAQRNAAVSAITGMGSGAGEGATGGPGGAAIGAGLGAIGGIGALGHAALTQQQIQGSTAIANAATARAANQQIGTAGYMRDTNKSLADWAARGDYANTIAGIQARVQDARLTQPSTSGQMGGAGFNLVNGYVQFSARWKMPNLNALRAIGDFWLRYGYSVRQFVNLPTTMQVMSKFTYWKLTETYISQAPIPEGFKQIIRGIFEKGVTVWSNPDDIGVTDWADNTPLPGISY